MHKAEVSEGKFFAGLAIAFYIAIGIGMVGDVFHVQGRFSTIFLGSLWGLTMVGITLLVIFTVNYLWDKWWAWASLVVFLAAGTVHEQFGWW